MKFLVDECLAPLVAVQLSAAGHDAIHLFELDLPGHPDAEVMDAARSRARVLISADTDFGELLAMRGDRLPSVILLRRSHDPSDQSRAILAALPDVEESLVAGAIVVTTRDRIRVRDLPVESGGSD